MSSYDEKMLKEDTNGIKISAEILRSSVSRIILQNEHMLDLIRVLRRDNDDLVNERRSLLKDKEDLITAKQQLQSQLRAGKEKHVKTADDISQWCRFRRDCDTCNYMQIDDGGNGECDLEIYGDEPCGWSTHVIETLDRIMTFESQADTVVEDTEDDK